MHFVRLALERPQLNQHPISISISISISIFLAKFCSGAGINADKEDRLLIPRVKCAGGGACPELAYQLDQPSFFSFSRLGRRLTLHCCCWVAGMAISFLYGWDGRLGISVALIWTGACDCVCV